MILPDQHVLRYRDPKHSFLISRQILFRCPSRLRSIACCDFTNLRMQSSKLVTTTKKMKKQMSQLRAKVKFKHRGDWTPFHNQPWFLATPSCSSTNKLYSLVHSHLWGCSALYHSFHQPWCAQYKLKNSECRGPICGRLSYTIRKWVPVSGGRSNRDTPIP